MVISLDYDKTYTLDPNFWNDFISSAKAARNDVIMVTMRRQHEAISEIGIIIYYTGRMAKKPYMDSLGINVDVWIDDSPHWIYQDSF